MDLHFLQRSFIENYSLHNTVLVQVDNPNGANIVGIAGPNLRPLQFGVNDAAQCFLIRA
ncbi:hypothetical protein D3C77_528420 [compost metagenome]